MLRHKENLTELKTSVAVSMGEAPTEPTCGFARSRWVVVWRCAGYSSNNHTAEVVAVSFGGEGHQLKHSHIM